MDRNEILFPACPQCGAEPGTTVSCELCQQRNPALFRDAQLKSDELRNVLKGKKPPKEKLTDGKPLHGPGSKEWDELREQFNLPPYQKPPK
jgi:hypothetical protein